eukprot:scaffold84539_cov39-Phaeocystis_antarctica.AAC.1
MARVRVGVGVRVGVRVRSRTRAWAGSAPAKIVQPAQLVRPSWQAARGRRGTLQGGVLITRACQASGFAPEGRLDARTVDPHSLAVPQQRFLTAARYEGHLVRVRARVRANVR